MRSGFVSVIVTAGGLGRRFGGEKPKQFAFLGGKPILARTCAVFDCLDYIREIIVTVPGGFVDTAADMLRDYGLKKITAVIPGGTERQASVYNALRRLSGNTETVLIHDGVRPFVAEPVISAVINRVEQGYAASAGTRMTDTVKMSDNDDYVTATLDRSCLWSVQTPQGFAYQTILAAHEAAASDGLTCTDDAMLVERLNINKLVMVESGKYNIKITIPEDMIVGEALLSLHKD